MNNELVIEKTEESKKLFGADDIKNLKHLISSKIEELKNNEKIIEELSALSVNCLFTVVFKSIL